MEFQQNIVFKLIIQCIFVTEMSLLLEEFKLIKYMSKERHSLRWRRVIVRVLEKWRYNFSSAVDEGAVSLLLNYELELINLLDFLNYVFKFFTFLSVKYPFLLNHVHQEVKTNQGSVIQGVLENSVHYMKASNYLCFFLFFFIIAV